MPDLVPSVANRVRARAVVVAMVVAIPVALLAGSYAIAFFLPLRSILIIVGSVYALATFVAWVVVVWWRNTTVRHRRVTLAACAAAVLISQAIPRPSLRSWTSGGPRQVSDEGYVLGPIEVDMGDAINLIAVTRTSGIGWPFPIWEWEHSDWSGRVRIARQWKDAPLEWFNEPWGRFGRYFRHHKPGATIRTSRLWWVLPNALCSAALAFTVVGVCPAVYWYVRGLRRIPPGHCRSCSYNLTGNVSGICPECGTSMEQP